MKEFTPGDRVRVRATPETGIDAGKAGAVVGVKRDNAGTAIVYVVRLDDDPANFCAGIDVPFRPDELEPLR
jgi:hypothetical protein